jgi:transcriptional adapter 2-alpha
MKNKLLNNKRARDSSDDIIDEKQFEETTNQKNEDIPDDNQKEKELEEKEKKNEKNISMLPNQLEKGENEDDLYELVFKLNSKNKGVECYICKKILVNDIKFLCQKCNNQIYCLNCFLTKKHPPDHGYQIIDDLNYPLFTEDWKMREEYKLLHNLSLSGLNNWEDISDAMGNRGQMECESHYYSFYYTEKNNPMPKENSIIIDSNKNIIKEKLEENKKIVEKNKCNEILINKVNNIQEEPKEVKSSKKKRNRRCLCLRKNLKNGEVESAGEILGCRPKRREFETEFLNDAEIEIGHLEFNDNDNEEELKIKYDVLKDYNLRIKEREQRKNFVFDKGLLDLRRQNRIESKLSRDEYELLLFLKPFARFYEYSEFFDLFEGIAIEQELKLTLKNLNKLEKEKSSSKGEKICTIEEIEKYFDVDKNLNRTRKSGNLFTNISEPKNIMNLLGHRVERFLNYHKENYDNNNNQNKIFDDDEYQLVKEMPLARCIFFDIKCKAKNILEKNNEKDKFSKNFMELLGEYDLETQTKNDIFNFYIKKFNNSFVESNKIKNNNLINGLNIINSNSNIKINNNNANNENIINNERKLLYDNFEEQENINKNHNNSKYVNYQNLKLNFCNKLENENNFYNENININN